MSKFFFILILLTLISCGKAVEEKDKFLSTNQEGLTDGTYRAFLFPVNGGVINQIDGEINVSRYGDEFKVSVSLKNAPPGTHKQSLHSGSGCPKEVHDVNRDGLIDTYEARVVMGQILVPFDDDLSSQSRGNTFYPSGSYRYARSTSYGLMLSDLHQPDDVINDNIIKLLETDLPLEARAVSIYGKSPKGDIPIACGILTRVNETPSQNEEDWRESEAMPRPRPIPRPEPPPVPTPEPEPDSQSWWDSIRRRWNEWWNRKNEIRRGTNRHS
jgi:hypothetical protein